MKAEAGEMTEHPPWRGLVIQVDQGDVWCAVVPGPGMGETFCGRCAVFYRAMTTGQQPTCPECLRAMGVDDEH